ncbi:MAG: aminopeptidase P family N-terminal domain-containing protein, partial [Lachnospiraceae bacterium]|nr:aminopeptidase P family N-terminal domain-containing protein [Lachnospiraceae bacterium]
MDDSRLIKLRTLMRTLGVGVYLVPTADFHDSEYVGAHFKARAWLTGFSGSAGTAVVTEKKAALFTDGRYFIQAERELTGSGFTLYRSGDKGIPTVEEFVESELEGGKKIGFDGRVVSAAFGKKLAKIAEEKGAEVLCGRDLVGEIWSGRPERSCEKAWILDEKYAGESASSKIGRLREKMTALGATVHILTSLDDIAWLLNIRGNDIPHCPVVLSFLMLTQKGCVFYVSPKALTLEIRQYLTSIGVAAAPYEDIYKMADMLSEKHMGSILLDERRVSFRIAAAVEKSNEIIDLPNPTLLMKAVKNETELKNIRAAHIKDGIAMVKWLYWLKNSIENDLLTEISVSDKLEEFRRAQEGFIDLSFSTIAAYGANAAMMHYSAKPNDFSVLRPEGFLLADSGGHYLEGSTDITRTIALGPLTEKENTLFTTVL